MTRQAQKAAAFRALHEGEPFVIPNPWDALATRRELANAFAEHWPAYVGHGELVNTRRKEGWRVLLEARAEQRPRVKSLAFEVWK